MNTVTLTAQEMLSAIIVGGRRHVEAITRSLEDKHGSPDDPWGAHIEGACGEMAFAKFSGRYWDGSVNTFKFGADVGDIQVRTRSRHDYELIVRHDDRDSDAFVLVTGKAPEFRIIGWTYGEWAKRPEFLASHGGRKQAFFVPHYELRMAEEMKVAA